MRVHPSVKQIDSHRQLRGLSRLVDVSANGANCDEVSTAGFVAGSAGMRELFPTFDQGVDDGFFTPCAQTGLGICETQSFREFDREGNVTDHLNEASLCAWMVSNSTLLPAWRLVLLRDQVVTCISPMASWIIIVWRAAMSSVLIQRAGTSIGHMRNCF